MDNKQNESFNKLEAIVNESQPESFDYDVINSQLEDRSERNSIRKSEDVINQAKRIYGDNQEAVFKTWMSGTKDFNLNRNTREYYWKTYDDLSGNPEISQETLRTESREKVKNFSNTYDKEAYIRKNLDRWPEWLEKEYEPVLSNLMIMNQSKDMLKNEFIYKESTLDRVNSILDESDLDPDITDSDHSADFKKFATMGLLDGAIIANGRLSIRNEKGELQPAWSISDVSSITGKPDLESPAMSAFLRDSVENEINSLVSVNVNEAREKIKAQTERLNSSIFYEMRQGNIPVDRWGDMAALTEDPTISSFENLGYLFYQGILGHIDNNPDIKDGEIAQFVNLVVDKYAHLLAGGPRRG